MTHELEFLLNMLHTMKPLGANKMRTNLEEWVTRLTRWLRIVAVGLFALLVCIALWMRFVAPVHGVWQVIALSAGLGALLLVLLILILDIIPTIVTIYTFREDALRRFHLEIRHDLFNVAELIHFQQEMLEQAIQWLEIKSDRIKGKIAIFLGGADKIALFALAGIGWAVLKEFPSQDASWKHDLFIYGIAFMGGIAVGAVLQTAVMQRYVCHRELLTLALDYQAKSLNLPRLYTVTEPTFRVRLLRFLHGFVGRQ